MEGLGHDWLNKKKKFDERPGLSRERYWEGGGVSGLNVGGTGGGTRGRREGRKEQYWFSGYSRLDGGKESETDSGGGERLCSRTSRERQHGTGKREMSGQLGQHSCGKPI